jgi:hypothetical protein
VTVPWQSLALTIHQARCGYAAAKGDLEALPETLAEIRRDASVVDPAAAWTDWIARFRARHAHDGHEPVGVQAAPKLPPASSPRPVTRPGIEIYLVKSLPPEREPGEEV